MNSERANLVYFCRS